MTKEKLIIVVENWRVQHYKNGEREQEKSKILL
jgi:hypothetical protein